MVLWQKHIGMIADWHGLYGIAAGNDVATGMWQYDNLYVMI